MNVKRSLAVVIIHGIGSAEARFSAPLQEKLEKELGAPTFARIAYPGTKLPKAKRARPWWLNFYDPDDILGFPLAEIGPRYEALARRGELEDKPINAGGLAQWWNPLSHNGYWKDDDLAEPLAVFLRRLL